MSLKMCHLLTFCNEIKTTGMGYTGNGTVHELEAMYISVKELVA